jgi:hypothetical protein
MPLSIPCDALNTVLRACREHCECVAPATRMLDLLLAMPQVQNEHEAASVLASEWGRALAIELPSEDELLWLGGVWLGTAQRILGADSAAAEAFGQLFAAAAERALLSAIPADAISGPAAALNHHRRPQP